MFLVLPVFNPPNPATARLRRARTSHSHYRPWYPGGQHLQLTQPWLGTLWNAGTISWKLMKPIWMCFKHHPFKHYHLPPAGGYHKWATWPRYLWTWLASYLSCSSPFIILHRLGVRFSRFGGCSSARFRSKPMLNIRKACLTLSLMNGWFKCKQTWKVLSIWGFPTSLAHSRGWRMYLSQTFHHLWDLRPRNSTACPLRGADVCPFHLLQVQHSVWVSPPFALIIALQTKHL